MENKSHAFAAGAFVIAVVALLLGLATWLSRDQQEGDIYELSTAESVTGLSEQAAVRFRGINIGKVTQIGFDPLNKGQVLLRISIRKDVPLTESTYATLGYQGVTGLAFCGRTEDRGNVVITLDIGLGCEIQVAAVGLRFAREGVLQVLLGLRTFQAHVMLLVVKRSVGRRCGAGEI